MPISSFALEGAQGPGTSVYVCDPDDNLLEFIIYDEDKLDQHSASK